MRVVIQRVSEARVIIEGKVHSEIGHGLMILAGWEDSDTTDDLKWVAQKISRMRLFDDSDGVMNRSVQEVQGELMVVSQFTLHAATKKGNRPSYYRSAPGAISEPHYEAFLDILWNASGLPVKSGVFGAEMKIELTNDGPVTITMDSKNKE